MAILFAQCCQISVKVVEKAVILCYKRRWKFVLFCFLGGFFVFFFLQKGQWLVKEVRLWLSWNVWRVNLTKHFSFTIVKKEDLERLMLGFFSGCRIQTFSCEIVQPECEYLTLVVAIFSSRVFSFGEVVVLLCKYKHFIGCSS